MPGPLSAPHLKYEQNCDKCHDPFDRMNQRQLCLDCHKKVATDVTDKLGFHGKSEGVGESECRHCHTEHQGLEATIVLLDEDVFDHIDTDFELRFTHQTLRCSKCHLEKVKHRDTPSKCVDCHRQKEPHLGRLGEECNKCHRETRWQDYQFDHSTTKFELKGVHQDRACISCHANQQWKLPSKECIGCHGINNPHGTRFGSDCAKCHRTEKIGGADTKSNWKNTSFDHQKARFVLSGKHGQVPCLKCHMSEDLSPTTPKDKPLPSCFVCHRNDDFHKTRFGQACEKCHNPNGWKLAQQDHGKTKFPLLERHAAVACTKCHTGSLFEQKLSLECKGCHNLDDIHRGAFGDGCEKCHTPIGWKQPAAFEHQKTKFQLEGKHSELKCIQCHSPGVTKETLPKECFGCHKANDVHKGQEGTVCSKCHNTSGWRANVFFDHDLTQFPLIGLHAMTPCESCHASTSFKDTPADCYGCHATKDPHQKRLGMKCADCHNPNGWKLWTFDHDRQSRFILEGAHVGLDCMACHLYPMDENQKPSMECVECHRDKDPHRGKFGRFCQRCHIPESFKKVRIGR